MVGMNGCFTLAAVSSNNQTMLLVFRSDYSRRTRLESDNFANFLCFTVPNLVTHFVYGQTHAKVQLKLPKFH